MLEKLKSVGAGVFILFFFMALLLLAAVLILGVGWVTSKLFPLVRFVAGSALLILVFVLLPLSVFRRTRKFAATAILYLSFVFGIRLWMAGLLTTLSLWGMGAVIVGFLMAGVGVVPLGMLAALFRGQWNLLIDLIVFSALTFGSRFLAIWLEAKVNRSAMEGENYEDLTPGLDEEF